MINFATVIVTYGSSTRFSNLKVTIESALEQGTSVVYVVNNGANYDVDQRIKSVFSKVKVINLPENKGSAVGFPTGLTAAITDVDITESDYILILDDDVKISDGFKKSLEEAERNYGKEPHIWSMVRSGRDQTFFSDSERTALSYHNSIAGFSLFDRFKPDRIHRVDGFSRPVFVPWAGILGQKKYLSKVELPSPNYFVYEDDSQFSLNVRKTGIQIVKSESVTLEETSSSWFENDSKKSGYGTFYSTPGFEGTGRFLYMVRNNVYLMKNNEFVSDVVKYIVNVFVFIIYGYIRYGFCRKHSLKKLRMIVQAIRDGWTNKMGKNPDWRL
ncbi:MAG: glycosyltransferase [Weissella confusa]